jgi:hypothetical protein
MKQDDEIRLLKELAAVLEKQIELVRHDDIANMDDLVAQSAQLTMKITNAGLLEMPQYDEWRERLAGLYSDLQLMLSSQKDAVAGQLRSLDKGKKTLAMYRDSI